jgi:hypothetical protein
VVCRPRDLTRRKARAASGDAAYNICPTVSTAPVHVDKGDGTAKLWLNPVRLAWTEGLKATEVRRALRIAEQQQEKLLEAWNEFFVRES